MVIGFLGNINPNKGFHRFCSVLSEFNGVSGIQFCAAGSVFDSQTSYAERCLEIAFSTDVEFVWLGEITSQEVFFKQIDIMVCCSEFESSPTVVWESLSYGVPVISTDVGDVGRIFEKYHCGAILEICDGPSVRRAIEKLMGGEFDIEKLKRNCLRAAKENFGLAVVSKSYDEYVSMICGHEGEN